MKTARGILLHAGMSAAYLALGLRSLKIETAPLAFVFFVFAALCALTLPFALRRKPSRLYVAVSNVLILALILPVIASLALYESFFFRHFDTPAEVVQSIEDYPGLIEEPHAFSSDRGLRLEGALYQAEACEAKALAVLAHGYGVGHRGYLSVVDALARSGYLVFAYDATGYDASAGRSAWGLPQATNDLDAAIRFAERLPESRDLPVVLFGHSLGGYAVGCATGLHPEVCAAVSLAGFSDSLDIIRAQGRRLVGSAIDVLLPYLSLYESIKFGAAASRTGVEGFGSSAARVLIAHSADDATVPIEFGLDRYRQAFEGDARFTFLRLDRRGHENLFTNADARIYISFLDEAVDGR